jgi:glycosyltransferase involved in cell wall biosynthesis
MKFVFWQNMLSIHQSSFIRALAATNDVTLVVEKEIEEWRASEGWTLPDFGNTRILVAPAGNVTDGLINETGAIHLFSGVAVYDFVHAAFLKAVARKARVAIVSEPFDWLGIKGKMRYVKYVLFRMRYEKHIDFILAIGHKGRACFEKVGFPQEKIFDWGYFTEMPDAALFNTTVVKKEKPSLIYVGRINDAKGILPLVSVCREMESEFEQLTIIGQGDKAEALKGMINGSPKYQYLGVQDNTKVKEHIAASDLTILPSIGKDGWGAVVNESLMLGVPVITSDYCGAAVLLDGQVRGEVFSVAKNELSTVLRKWVARNNIDRNSIREWANRTLSGMAAAEYLVAIANAVYSGNKNKIRAPWLMQ